MPHEISNVSKRPVQDEWGLYDPEQAGFQALLRRLALLRPDQAAVTTPPSPRPADAVGDAR